MSNCRIRITNRGLQRTAAITGSQIALPMIVQTKGIALAKTVATVIDGAHNGSLCLAQLLIFSC
jgi:hypothetical protein